MIAQPEEKQAAIPLLLAMPALGTCLADPTVIGAMLFLGQSQPITRVQLRVFSKSADLWGWLALE